MKDKKWKKTDRRAKFYNMGMDDELFEKIKQRAFEEDLSMNKLLKKAAREYLNKNQNK